MPDILKELRRRNVFRVGIAYLALAWVIIQVTAIAIPALNLPLSLSSIVFYLGLIGFPFAILFGWAYELTPDGLKRSSEVEASESIRGDTGRRMERVIMGLLAVAVVFFLVREFSGAPETVQVAVSEPMAVAPDAKTPLPVQASIAVLPFVNMSEDKDYFSDGLSEEILNLLAKVPELRVTGRTSSFAFKGKNEDLRTIGAALGVSKVLEGSVRKSGDRLRITAQLINVEDGFHLWSETYDRDMTDVFVVQDEIAGAILNALKIELGVAAPTRGLPTQNMEAYALYLEARALRYDFGQGPKAKALLKQVVDLDPAFAEAWETLAQVTMEAGYFTQAARAEGADYLETALTKDPKLQFSKFMLATSDLRGEHWQDNTALEVTLKAMEDYLQIQPLNGFVRGGLHNTLLQVGYHQASLDVIDAGLAVDPLVYAYLYARSQSLIALGRSEEAYETVKLYGDRTGFYPLRNWHALVPLRDGDEARARRYVTDFAEATGENTDEVLAYIKTVINPATLDEALQDPRSDKYLGPDALSGRKMRVLYLLKAEEFWDEFDALIASRGVAMGTAIQFMIMGDRWFLSSPRVKELIEQDGSYIAYWRTHRKPDYCQSFDVWICELNPDG